jgi:aminoglycoside phosphotransferase family enzyme/predicted kinase
LIAVKATFAGIRKNARHTKAKELGMLRSTTGHVPAGCDDQAEVVAFLGDPASYPTKPDRIERFETHGALVFLAGGEAWKIKRAVRFPYMDLSTLEKRKAVCQREVGINRRFAPEIYLGCTPITRAPDGRLEFGGDGDIVEWAVHMRRFDQTALLGRVAKAGPMPPALAADLADVVYESHRAGEPPIRHGEAERVERLVGSVWATLSGLQHILGAAAVQRFRERATHKARRCASLLDARASAGLVRRCHGDLHLNNIVLWHGRPRLFDAIEFDDDLATIDTLYDLAFLLMDLDRNGQRLAANIVLNRYLWRSNTQLDLRGLRTLPLFLGLRAGIRAMVTAERAEQEAGDANVRDRLTACALLDAAIAYLTPNAPQLIAIGGFSGTGKSTLGRALAPEVGAVPGAIHLRSDLERKSLHGVDETERLGPVDYTEEARRKVYAMLRTKAREVLAAGHAAVVDAVFDRPDERAKIEAAAVELGVSFRGLWLEAPPSKLLDRVGARKGDASDATPDVVRRQLAAETRPLTAGWVSVDAGDNAAATLAKAREALARS